MALDLEHVRLGGRARLNVFGAGTLLFGTVVTSGLALLFAVPLGIGIGVYLACSHRVEWAP